MTTKQLKQAAKNNSFENVNFIIENSGLCLELIQEFPFSRLWKVVNNREVCFISNTIADLNTGKAQLKFVFND